MLGLALVLVVLSADPIKLAAPGLDTVGMQAGLGAAYLDRLVSLLEAQGPIKVTTARDLEQVLGLERQRQLLGCGDNASCLAELSGALGVHGVLSGSLARSGDDYLITLRVIRARDGASLATASGRVSGEKALNEWLEIQAQDFAGRVLEGFGRRGELVAAPVEPASRWPRYVPAVLGGAAVATGIALWAVSAQDAATLKTTTSMTGDEIRGTAQRGAAFQVAGPVLIAAGVAGIATTVVWTMLDVPVKASVAPVGGGGGVVLVEGRF